jgi:hypothetical protein
LRSRSTGAEDRIRLDHVNDAAVLVQIKQIQRDPNAPLGQSSERRQPEAFTGLQRERCNPVLELRQREVRSVHFQPEKALASLVVSAKFP